ncbi:hypothetical protein QBC37DRAFT_474393 [Rhypophila decipiens]|uniref:Uncharacterized protein n=1 Tax=Rhypophila decipiens TaxID=261697 RepID=A0AAN6Y548_9PEZI|nr:hypothetical protein QBC37DRAFT_474393 [Rhypophila decipiens]
MDGPEILVGIDFGTTYSGVSWAVNSGVRRIQLITDWPGVKDETTQLEKVPSLISIDGRYPDERRWGFEADKNHSPAWFKLWLDPSLHGTSPLGNFVMGSNSPVSNDMFRNAQQATVDYLRCLWSHAGAHIRRQVGSSSFEPKLVLTVPAMWSPTAIQTLQMAAIEAGLPENIHILPEPEAALHHILHEERHLLTPEIAKGDVYTVCDAGGATVNVITYIVSSVEPLIVSQYVPAQGGLCGATFIDMHFEEYVKTKVGEEAYTRLKDASKAQMMHDFERQLKRGFRGDVRGNAGVRLDGVDDNPKMGVFNERIYITDIGRQRDSLRAIFDPVCNEVARLVEEQVRAVRRKGRHVKRVFLVGGFGANPYLRQVISNKVKIRVVQAIDT